MANARNKVTYGPPVLRSPKMGTGAASRWVPIPSLVKVVAGPAVAQPPSPYGLVASVALRE